MKEEKMAEATKPEIVAEDDSDGGRSSGSESVLCTDLAEKLVNAGFGASSNDEKSIETDPEVTVRIMEHYARKRETRRERILELKKSQEEDRANKQKPGQLPERDEVFGDFPPELGLKPVGIGHGLGITKFGKSVEECAEAPANGVISGEDQRNSGLQNFGNGVSEPEQTFPEMMITGTPRPSSSSLGRADGNGPNSFREPRGRGRGRGKNALIVVYDPKIESSVIPKANPNVSTK